MSLAELAVTISQASLGLVGLVVGRTKVTHQRYQIDEFERYGYPQWLRIVTGVVEVKAGIALLLGIFWRPEPTWVGGVLLSSVLAAAVATHVRLDDPSSRTAVPAILLTLTAGLLTIRYL